MRKALATVFLTVGLTAVFTLLASGATPSLNDAEIGLTLVLVAGGAATVIGVVLFVQAGKSAKLKAQRLGKLAELQTEAQDFSLRAMSITDNQDTPALDAERNAWMVQATEWFEDNLPLYGPTFQSNSPPTLVGYGAVSEEANLIVNWAQGRVGALGRIIRSVAGEEPD